MIKLNNLLAKPKAYKRLTGLSPARFQMLVTRLEPRWQRARIKRLSRPNRERAIGAGSKYKLTSREALFVLLLYYRTYLSHLFIGYLMDLDESNISRYIKRVEPLLAGMFRIPERRIKLTPEEALELIVDATEQESEKRKGSGYSGKKRRQTIKTQIVVTSTGQIKSVSKSIKGNVHDKKLYDKTRAFSMMKVRLKADLGYEGTACDIPIKKQPRQGLTKKQKEYNRDFNRKRYPVERTFAHLKNFKILGNRWRNKFNTYNLVFKNVAGIYNWQLA